MHKAHAFKKKGVYAYHLCALQPCPACSIEPRIHMHTDTCSVGIKSGDRDTRPLVVSGRGLHHVYHV